ncbi:hypothetical protein H0H87_012025 [Tephrocybe sp. NHM501043]|nr:hypothetical protein H0H87_012025 [Tephrocybe sp. NHM501043]
MFPSLAALTECRLPSPLSFRNSPSQRPSDTLQGELDYNPFAFDVGMLGVFFCEKFQHLTPVVPMLAPLLDKMTTRNILSRFTASEALEFFEQHVLDSPLQTGKQVPITLPLTVPLTPYDLHDRWKHLDPAFIQQWAMFREPPLPRHVVYFRRICQSRWGPPLVTWIRRTARLLRLWLIPF